MDNNLSELSKPVAWAHRPEINAPIDVTENEYVARNWRDVHERNVQPLYSQEYVSALLAEIGEKERSLISNCVDYEYDLIEMKRRAEAAEQRVAELEQAMKEQSNG
ncbi:hypothetical protein [Serratia marcescens]|uniref:hypothetical protein n=1 Tax=Serratia marcescens TaxID=615 RepID=UPI00202A883F|nr:hypothetical protein [Serratia marcescens]